MSDDNEFDAASMTTYQADSVFMMQRKEVEDMALSGEKHKFEIYQNQRHWMGMFKDVLFPHERPNWSDKDGRTRMTKDSVKLPPDWKW